ncbi:MAG: hypothetical protein JWL77_4038 [Chthonomonadaceae bacterium]|nr:hypothetical protein [Chthonomonadaceae bacterium]
MPTRTFSRTPGTTWKRLAEVGDTNMTTSGLRRSIPIVLAIRNEAFRLYHFLRKERTPDTEPEPPTYDDLVTRVLQAPTEGQGLLDLGVRLEEWQNSHWTRYEVARAFLRHAVMQMPDSSEAHRCYGKSLVRTQRDKGLFHLREAVRLAPADAEGYFALGQSLVDKDRAEALKTLLKAVQLDPEGNSGRKARNVIASSQLDGE